MEIKNPQQHKRFTTAKTALILGKETSLFGAGAMRLELVEDYSQPTAYTNGVVIGYNPDYLASLSDAEVVGLMAHEVAHCQFGHPWRLGDRDKQTANIAMDYAIDYTLTSCGLTVPDALLDDRFDGKAFEQIYAILDAERPPKEEPDDQPGDGKGGGDQPQGQDQGAPGDGDQSGDQPQDGQGEPSDKPGDKPTKGEVRQAPANAPGQDIEAEWRAATLAAAALADRAGTLPAGLKELIGQFVRPIVDWRGLLAQWVSSLTNTDYSWSRPSRRHIGRGMYLPSLSVPRVGKIVVAADTSGSMTTAQARAIFGGLQDILVDINPESIEFIQFDTAVNKHVTLEPGDAIDPTIYGRGGTDFRPVFEWIENFDEPIAGLIVFTDLEGPFPDQAPDYPVLWAAFASQPEVPFGDAVEVLV